MAFSKIQEMKDTLRSQTEMIKTLREERNSGSEDLKKIFSLVARGKVDFQTDMADFSSLDYPDVRFESAAKMTATEITSVIAQAFKALMDTGTSACRDLVMISRELDAEIDADIQEFQAIRAQESKNNKARAFRGDTPQAFKEQRPATPDVPLVDRSRADSVVASPQNLEQTPKKDKSSSSDKAKKAKTPMQKAGDLFTGSASASKSSNSANTTSKD